MRVWSLRAPGFAHLTLEERSDPSPGPREVDRALTFHRVRPVVDRCFRFEEAPAALGFLQAGSHFGKIVVTR